MIMILTMFIITMMILRMVVYSAVLLIPAGVALRLIISTASGALVVGGVRDICIMYVSNPPEIALSVQWSRTNQSVAVCGSL